VNLAHHQRRRVSAAEAERSAHDPPLDLTFAPPPRFDRPVGAVNQVFVSPVTIQHLPNDQEMQSGADEIRGVEDSDLSGGDYSREQGEGRAPGWTWPWNLHVGAFNVASLDRWAVERSGLGLLDPHSGVNPYVGTPVMSYSPITAMDQYTTYYENDPNQWYGWPAPVSIPDAPSVPFTELAVLQ
jgi:hypothetical protein